MSTRTKAAVLARRVAATALATAASMVPAIARAQDESEPAPPVTPVPAETTPPAEPSRPPIVPCDASFGTTARTLGDHVFIFPARVSSSFVTTYVGLRLRLGTQSFNDAPTPAGNTTIDTVTFAEGLDFGVKITDWLGIFVAGGEKTLIGSNLKALTYAGATYGLSGEGGLTGRVYRNDRTGTQLSLSARGGYGKGQVSSLFPIFDQPVLSALDLLQGDLGEAIKTPFTTVNYSGAVSFAQSVSRLFGIQAAGGFGGATTTTEPYDRATKTRGSNSANSAIYMLEVAPSFDLNAFHVPIAIVPEYVFSRQASSAEIRGAGTFDTTHTIAGGVYYSGRENLQIGLVWSTQLGLNPLQLPLGESGTTDRSDLELILRYIW